MAVSRRLIITELKNRGIHPGLSKDYAADIFSFLVEAFHLNLETLEATKKEYLLDTSNAIKAKIRDFMHPKGKPRVGLDRVLNSSTHKVL